MCWGDLHECKTCNLSQYCTRCSGIALLENGDLFAPSDLACEIARARKRSYEVEKNV